MLKVLNIRYIVIVVMAFFSVIANADFNEIEKLLEQKQATLKRELKNIPYENKEYGFLPKISEQMFFCYNEHTCWLEITNYEFMVNGKESNQLIKIVIGKSNKDIQNEKNVIRKAMEILDPEFSFVFQDAILRYWDKLIAKSGYEPTMADLFNAIQIGYNAIDYHLGVVVGPTSILDSDVLSPRGLMKLIQTRQNQYKTYCISKNRYVSFNDIKKNENLGFAAYYANPIYLNDLAWYIRPSDMSYKDYAKYSYDRNNISTLDDVEILLSSSIKSAKHNDYYDILKRLYPQKSIKLHPENVDLYFIYCNIAAMDKNNAFKIIQEEIKNIQDESYDIILCDSGSFLYLASIVNKEIKKVRFLYIKKGIGDTIEQLKNKIPTNVSIKLNSDEKEIFKVNTQFSKLYSDFKTISYEDFKILPPSYVFRGDNRNLENIAKSEGFWVLPHKVESEEYDVKNNLETVKKIDNAWKIKECDLDLCSAGTAYLAASRKLNFANNYGKNVYAIFATNAIDLPTVYENNNTHDMLHTEAVIPVGVDFENVVGVRHKENSLLVGPVFLKIGLETNDTNNFWKMLHLFGGKSQANKKRQVDFMNSICQGEFSTLNITRALGYDDEAVQVSKHIDGTTAHTFMQIENNNILLQSSRLCVCPSFKDEILGLQGTMRV